MRVMEPAKYLCFCACAVHTLGTVTTLHGVHLHLNTSVYGVAMFSGSVSRLRLVGAESMLVSTAFNMHKVLIRAVQLHTCLWTVVVLSVRLVFKLLAFRYTRTVSGRMAGTCCPFHTSPALALLSRPFPFHLPSPARPSSVLHFAEQGEKFQRSVFSVSMALSSTTRERVKEHLGRNDTQPDSLSLQQR